MSEKRYLEITGYHGTTPDRAKEILDKGFRVNEGEEDWVGSGIYFFIDGISSAKDMAADWSCFRNRIDKPCILYCSIKADYKNVLDLRLEAHAKQFNYHRNLFIEQNTEKLKHRRDLSIKKRKDIRLDDAIITRSIFRNMEKSLIIHNLYIKTKTLRHLEMESSYPTTTVCCVGQIDMIKSIEVLVDC
ncbi:hypothetical protein SAMN02982917_5624 [Azospirillum oryzae]|uniref:DUF3990 domain-containing protein n=1 Tax=Azospirillum oryzae TaxID=286727 RepID=A0A1X7HCB4_9PROT|nr:hypothetical protein SAMN02982917_5624 [Azospirillum oryzae]